MLFLDRSRAGSSRYLDWKVHMFMAGSVLVLAGIYLGNRWIMWGALIVLAGAFALRFLPGNAASVDDGDGDQTEDGGEGD